MAYGWGQTTGRRGGGGGGGAGWKVALAAAAVLVGVRYAHVPALAPVRAAVAQAAEGQAGTPGPARRFIAAIEGAVRGGLDGNGWRWPPLSGGMQVKTLPPKTPPLRYPVSGAILMPFGSGTDPLTGKKVQMDGLLLAAVAGATVRAPAAGRIDVVRDGPAVGEEIVVAVSGRKDIRVAILGVGNPRVRVGQTVGQGQPLGVVPAVGPNTTAHIVLEVLVGGIPVDPLSPLFLGPPA